MKNFDTKKTIISISTPIGSGGISIVRMSGEDSINIADRVFITKNKNLPSSFEDRKLYLGNINSDLIKEKCLCVVFRAPNSFTGDNIVEFQCHGGIKITQEIINICIKNGAKLAGRGEFSMRAFLNGKMTLAEAEGMMDTINAESDAELKASYTLSSGELSKKSEELQKEIIDIMSDIEVSFDYPEHDIEYKTKLDVKKRLLNIQKFLDEILKTSKTGKLIKDGINVLIIGKPNVGKSSLLNSLIGKDKAIVTDVPGTTRDVIEDSFIINGVKVNLIDTAGIHDTDDKVEKIGVEKSKDYIKLADLILFIIDGSEEINKKDKDILKLIENNKYIKVINKSDLIKNKKDNNAIYISAKKGTNINALKELIYKKVIDEKILSSSILLTNERHVKALQDAKDAILSAINNIDNNTLDVISIDIMDAFYALGEITGTSSSEEVINSIFSKFCLGK